MSYILEKHFHSLLFRILSINQAEKNLRSRLLGTFGYLPGGLIQTGKHTKSNLVESKQDEDFDLQVGAELLLSSILRAGSAFFQTGCLRAKGTEVLCSTCWGLGAEGSGSTGHCGSTSLGIAGHRLQ